MIRGRALRTVVLFGTLFAVPYYLSAEHVRPALVGLGVALLPIGIGVAAPFAGRLLNRIGERPLTTGGLILTGLALLELALWRSTPGLLAGLALTGVGLGAFTPANNATIMAASPPGHTGVTGGVLNMTRGLGTALGVALAGALYTATSVPGAANGADTGRTAAVHGLTATLLVFGLTTLGTVAATALAGRRLSGGNRARSRALYIPRSSLWSSPDGPTNP